jgi:predicted esterase
MACRVFAISLAAALLASAAQVREVSYGEAPGTKAWLVEPDSRTRKAPHCAVLFVHWYEPEAGDSNRNQYLREAIPLADSHGCVSLLVDTMWSRPEWFRGRDASRDFENSEAQVRNLGQALDYLLARKDIDRNRVAYVGHDFGAMYGAVLASRDKRVRAWALQAGTASFSDWFLYFPQRTGDERQAVIDRLAPLDPVRHIANAKPLLLQFGKHDRHVPEQRAKQMFEAAQEPKQVLWYEAGHGLNSQAVQDRLEWLEHQLSPIKARRIEIGGASLNPFRKPFAYDARY